MKEAMTHNICDACETVAHCSKFGCIPLTPEPKADAHVASSKRLVHVLDTYLKGIKAALLLHINNP